MNPNIEEILTQIIDKSKAQGGLLEYWARVSLRDPATAKVFLSECSQQCHTEKLKNLFGAELISAIMKTQKSINQ